MYAVVRRYKVKPGMAEEIARRAQEGFVPLVSKIPGFVAYYGIVAENNEIATVSIFQDQAGEEESTRHAADWVRQNVAELVEGQPDILAGRVGWHTGGQA